MRPLASFTASGEDISLGDLNIFRTLARHPALFQSWAPFGGFLLTNGTLPFHERELLILRTGFNCRSPYEWGQHVRIALNGGISREAVDRVAEGPDAEGWSPRESTLLRAADELHETNDALGGDVGGARRRARRALSSSSCACWSASTTWWRSC